MQQLPFESTRVPRTSAPDDNHKPPAVAFEEAFSRLALAIPGVVAAIRNDIAACNASVNELRQKCAEQSTTETLLRERDAECRELREQAFEQKVLGPVMQVLVTLAIRCREQIANMKRLEQRHANQATPANLQLMKTLVRQREADLVEVEERLANFDVRPFENPSATFVPQVQYPRCRVDCTEAAREGLVAKRVHPGYRTDTRIYRLELVDVYVRNGATITKGEQA